ncbi:MAG: type II toxin-antitoxin system prevent-host-death family antitoxin [Lachnospiraceae bacterium]|nr:type II toxin-antitoxin system prevent-host-death family antitoxin [Lachnospiraceae bacterium]
MEITATEFKTNLGHYLDLVPTEDIWVTKNGKYVARLVNPNVSAVDSISGILKGKASEDIDRHSIQDERVSRYETND